MVTRMNLGDPDLEFIDPTPNIHALFVQFDKLFFYTKLTSRAVVRWSKRMYSCAGICSYEGRGGLCDIALSEPLLKLRPRKNLIETLLHEMIHAYLFVTNKDRDRDGHGPNFQAHMHRINGSAGLNITIYHDFHDEVRLYQTHVWRCNGPCQIWKPYFGIVRRSANRAPGPNDFWYENHRRKCGGTFVKIKEPEMKAKKSTRKKENITKSISGVKSNKPQNTQKPILKNSNVITISDLNVTSQLERTKLPETNNTSVSDLKTTKSSGLNTVSVTNKGLVGQPVQKSILTFTGSGQTISSGRKRTNSVDVVETVRNVWANKRLSGSQNSGSISNLTNIIEKKTSTNKGSPPKKIKKIDDYFKSTATSVLKDIYGQNFKITESKFDNKLIVIAKKEDLVGCPVCSTKVNNEEINRHLDECLNKEIIESLCNNSEDNSSKHTAGMLNNFDSKSCSAKAAVEVTNCFSNKEVNNVEDFHESAANTNLINHITTKLSSQSSKNSVPSSTPDCNKEKEDSTCDLMFLFDDKSIGFTSTNIFNSTVQSASNLNNNKKIQDTNISFDHNDVNKVKSIVKKVTFDKHVRNSNKYIESEEKDARNINSGYLPSFLDDIAGEIKVPEVKLQPETSNDIVSDICKQKCPCCGNNIDKAIEEHLDECIAFFTDNSTIPAEGASTSFADHTIVLDDDDDKLDETQTMNATGTKWPCPCCLKMIEEADMNNHLDQCLNN